MLISIIIPAYNCEKTISRCIESILCQTYKNIEIIIVDDGSIDNTYSIVQNYSSMDNRIKGVTQENGGPGSARNKGLKLAKGDFFAFVDADDTVEPTYIESMVRVADKENLELVISNIVVQGKKRKKSSDCCTIINNEEEIKSKIIQMIKQGRLNSPIAKLYRKDIQKNNEVYMPTGIDIGEDLQFNLAYIQYVKKIGLLDSNLYNYYTENSTLTKKYRRNEYDLRIQNIKKLELFLKDNCIEDKQFIYYLYLKLMYAECMNMRRYVKKVDRLTRIRCLLDKEEIKVAIDELKPIGLLQIIMKFGCREKNVKKIDLVAALLNIGKKFGKQIKRASV